MKRMTPNQINTWRSHYEPRDAAFKKAKLSGRDLVRWKFQRYAKNYLRCVKGVDESLHTLKKSLESLDSIKTPLLSTPLTKVSTLEIMDGTINAGCMRSRSKCHLS
jgi:hypothetical protein